MLPESRNVIVTVTTEEGEVLARMPLVDINSDIENCRYIAVRPVSYSMGKYQGEEVLDIGG